MPEIGDRKVLPIGFPPSNIISNYALKKFDDGITDSWNPLYYGRYVDDIIILDKVEKNSQIYLMMKQGKLTAKDIIDNYLLGSKAWKDNKISTDQKIHGILSKINDKDSTKYVITKEFNEVETSDIKVQNDKVKLFYFNSKQSDALIDCFKNKLRLNKSEFRFLPEDEPVFQYDDYSEIYSLTETEGPNKLCGIENIEIDRFNLSKFLGKFSRIGGLIIDKKEHRFEKDIDKIFDERNIIDNYLAWEKIITILVNNERYKAAENFIKKIIKSIDNLVRQTDSGIKEFEEKSLSNTLKKFLTSILHRTLSIVGGESVNNLKNVLTNIEELSFDSKYLIYYRKTRMCDKYLLPLPIDGFLDNKNLDNIKYNLTKFSPQTRAYYNNNWIEEEKDKPYFYYPYLITINDIAVWYMLTSVHDNRSSPNLPIEKLNEDFWFINFNSNNNINSEGLPIFEKKLSNDKIAIKVGNDKKSKLKIAIASTVLKDDFLKNVLKDSPDRSYKRYSNLSKIINEAITEGADILVMPEGYVPFEWISLLARTCAKNKIAIVTGIEHIKSSKQSENNTTIYNLTAVILPFEYETYKYSYIYFHSKKHFSPSEIKTILSYRCIPCEGKGNELFCWNDFWFPVYCCYELASISDRAIFQTFADAIIAVEWNKDTNYYSNIVESLSRDLHTYFIQVNTAQYGDSRITRPSKTEFKDIIKLKGGINSTALIDYIDLSELRNFQLQGNSLQSESNEYPFFKMTPPNFNYNIVKEKIGGTLWENITNYFPK